LIWVAVRVVVVGHYEEVCVDGRFMEGNRVR
jgi:hypothetical protein